MNERDAIRSLGIGSGTLDEKLRRYHDPFDPAPPIQVPEQNAQVDQSYWGRIADYWAKTIGHP